MVGRVQVDGAGVETCTVTAVDQWNVQLFVRVIGYLEQNNNYILSGIKKYA